MAMMVADTDVLIDFLRGAESMASRIELELQKAGLSTTAVNAFELRSGAMGKKEKQQVDTLLAALGILPLCEAAAQRAAAIRRELEDRGASIGMADYLIAGICMEHRRVLLTRNLAHFQRIDGLAISGQY